ncbi:MAG: Grx4 family monothiol glutaredoxin [Bacteriovoracaceae bacterium]|nr:Grx4 family monothiol glutaredoxin [Bacteriovoracaceae bacterium]
MTSHCKIQMDKESKNYGSTYEDHQGELPAEERIKKMLSSSDIFVFIKGTSERPLCGFSANTVAVLNSLQKPYKTFNVLSDDAIREGVKAYSKWPTYPQIYIKGQLIGGNDIVTEMIENGELQKMTTSL